MKASQVLRSMVWSLPRPVGRTAYMLNRRLRGQLFDEMSLVHRLVPRTSDALLVDVGAHLGESAALFVHDGWQVIAIEPDPANRALLKRRYERWESVRVVPHAIAEEDGRTVPLFTSNVSSGISTLTPFHPSHHATDQVETARLDTLLKDTRRVTVLKSDSEGHDLMVLRTFPWQRLRPKVVVAEFDDRKTKELGYGYHDLAKYLAGEGYVVFVSEWWPVVEYGMRHRWRSMRRYPTTLDDDRGWGNIVAVEPPLADAVLQAVPRLRNSATS